MSGNPTYQELACRSTSDCRVSQLRLDLAGTCSVANSLCPGQEGRRMRETDGQIGNSRLIAKP